MSETGSKTPSGGKAARRRIHLPAPAPDNAEYFTACDRGELLLRRCDACGEVHHYPRPICPFCFSDRTEWVRASGRGVIYSYSVLHRADPPYCLAYVTLEEGPTMMTNIVDFETASLGIGARVRAVFVETEAGPKVPMFVLDAAAS